MENSTSVFDDLWKIDEGISVKAHIRFSPAVDKKYGFYIADGLIIDEINRKRKTPYREFTH